MAKKNLNSPPMLADTNQFSLFSEKVPVDKNLDFSTVVSDGQEAFKILFKETYKEDPKDILDVLFFLQYKIYNNPLSDPKFTIEEYAQFYQRNVKKYRGLTEGKKTKNYENDLERIFYKLMANNIVTLTPYKSPSNEEKEIMKPFTIITQFIRYKHENKAALDDKRKKMYEASVNPVLVRNLSTFFFYTTLNDYKKITKEYYRNPGYRNLYLRLSNLLNNLRFNPYKTQQPSFNELATILGYYSDDKENHAPNKEMHRMIDESVKKILQFDSLKGLDFSWQRNANGYTYVPNFSINNITIENNSLGVRAEDAAETYKRLDNLFLYQIKQYIPFNSHGFFEIEDFHNVLNSKPGLEKFVRDAFHQVYLDVLKKAAEYKKFDEWMGHFCYTEGKYRYGSLIITKALVDGKKIIHDERFKKTDSYFKPLYSNQ